MTQALGILQKILLVTDLLYNRFDEDEFDQDDDSDLSEMSDLSDDEDDDDEDIEDEDMMHRHHYHSGMEDDEVCTCFLTYKSFQRLDHFQPHLHGQCSNLYLSC